MMSTASQLRGLFLNKPECVIDLPALLRTLVKIGYSGFAAFEYEEDPGDPLPGLAESVGYIRGVLDAI